MLNAKNTMRVLAGVVIAVLMAACASMGRPEGGPKDVTPPVFVSSKPAPNTLNYTDPRVVITFDENIKVEDVLNKVVISPAQVQQPSVTASGRRLIVDIKDTLKPETTYTLDFSDAIRDLNEGNILDGFAMAFSTGDVLDTLQISGMVLQAENLEPAQGMLVGVYSNLADSAITTLPLERIARTNQLGQFTVRNLKPGDYRIFALNDLNRDLHWDRSEDVAFFDTIITPSASNYNFQDTLKSSLEEDSIVTRVGTAYAPADVLLCWFNENYSAQYLKDYKRPTNKMLEVRFAAPSDSLPLLTIVNGANEGRTDREWSRLDVNATRDSLNYWITLQISGMVLQAENLEPAQGMLVGVYSNLADSAITTLPLERIARTNQLGQFTVRNLKPGDYRIFALNDLNRDLHWDRSEDVAFFDTIITPSASNYNFQDTLKSSLEEDSIVTRVGTAYAPADVLLCWFNENYSAQYLKDYKRPTNKMLEVRFAAPSDSLPLLTIVNGANEGRTDREWSRLDVNATRDSLNYWITDSAVILQDSLLIAMRYLRTDTLDRISWTTDTLKFFYRPPKETKKKKKDDEEENDSLPKINFLTFNVMSQQSHDINKPLIFEASQPLDTILPKGVRLEQMIDSVWTQVYRARIVPDSLHPLLRYRMDLEWEPGADYRLTIDSAAIQGAYNEHNRPITHEFKVKGLEEYANLYFKLAQRDLPLVVELLNSSDAPVLRTKVDDDGMAEFTYVYPGTYYARCFIDTNGDGLWTTGSISEKIQPEEVYYYPGKLNLRKNWDIEQSWDIYNTPLDQQKPMDIKKNKPVTRERQQSDQDEEEDEEDFGDDMWNTSNKSYGTGSSYNNQHKGLQKAR